MIKVIIILVSIVVSMIIGAVITPGLPEEINTPLWEVANPIFTGFILAFLVVIVEIIIFTIINKKRLNKAIKNGQFYEGRIVKTTIDDIGNQKYYAICVDVETTDTIYHLAKTFFLNIEQVNNFEYVIKEKKLQQ